MRLIHEGDVLSLSEIEIPPLEITIREEEILADLLYPAPV